MWLGRGQQAGAALEPGVNEQASPRPATGATEPRGPGEGRFRPHRHGKIYPQAPWAGERWGLAALPRKDEGKGAAAGWGDPGRLGRSWLWGTLGLHTHGVRVPWREPCSVQLSFLSEVQGWLVAGLKNGFSVWNSPLCRVSGAIPGWRSRSPMLECGSCRGRQIFSRWLLFTNKCRPQAVSDQDCDNPRAPGE